MVWEKVLRDESKIELHAAMTPTWSETAQYADWILPMGHGAERHDLMSQETHAAKWISFRQPVLRVMRERAGEQLETTRDANPGEVWEEDEFWIELSWRIDPTDRSACASTTSRPTGRARRSPSTSTTAGSSRTRCRACRPRRRSTG
jgi:anaerobic selenocysteine-containing dehydrogenase